LLKLAIVLKISKSSWMWPCTETEFLYIFMLDIYLKRGII
jgi:hypothetical protein